MMYNKNSISLNHNQAMNLYGESYHELDGEQISFDGFEVVVHADSVGGLLLIAVESDLNFEEIYS
jgi:hypothetical protein